MTASSTVPEFILSLPSHIGWNGLTGVCSSLEAGFYASLKGGILNAHRLVKWIRETSIERIHTIQGLFNLANIATVILYTKQLIDEVQTRFSFSIVDLATLSLTTSFSFVCVAGTAFVIGVLILNKFTKPLDSPQVQGDVTISQKLSSQQKLAKALQTTKLVLTVALACFAKNRFWFVVSLLGTGYSLLKNSQLKWMKFNREFPANIDNGGVGQDRVQINKVTATYEMLALPKENSAPDEDCPICLQPTPDMVFCASHAFHSACMANLVIKKSDSFTVNAFTRWRIDHYQNNIRTHTTFSYSGTIQPQNVPTCPTCGEVPPQNDFSLSVSDVDHGEKTVALTIEQPPRDRQWLFERFSMLYSGAEGILAFLQKYPELAPVIFKIQKVLMVSDIFMIGGTLTYLYFKVKEKLNISQENSAKFAIAAAITATAIAVLSYFAIQQINALLKPAIALKELLQSLPLPAEFLQQLTIEWAALPYLDWMQTIHLYRAISTFALSFFSKQRGLNLVNAATQMFSLFGISQLRCLELTRSLQSPFKTIASEGGSVYTYLQTGMKSLEVKAKFLIHESYLTNPSHLQSAVHSIGEYIKNLFQKSSWDAYWMNYYRNGIFTHSDLHYEALLRSNSPSNLVDLSMKAVDANYGAPIFHVVWN